MRGPVVAARVTALLGSLLGGLSLLVVPAAGADAPGAQGWWNLANQGVTPPDPPDVPPDGLLVQGGPSGPSALSALRFDVPPGATVGALALAVTGPAPQAAAVLACPTTGTPWHPAQDGPWSAAPSYDCQHGVSGVLTGGTSLVFGAIGTLVRADGQLSVVLVAGQTDRVAIKHPDASALAVSGGAAPGGAGAPPPPPATVATAPPAPAPPPGGAPVPAALPVLVPAAVPLDAAPVPSSSPQVAPSPASGSAPTVVAVGRPAAAVRDLDGRRRLIVVLEALLVVASFGLLGAGPARRLAALTGEIPPAPDRPRGVGRFAQNRTGKAPRL